MGEEAPKPEKPEMKETEVPYIVEEIQMLSKLSQDRLGRDEFMDKQVAFAHKLRDKYPDWKNRRVYHALIKSTMDGDSIDTERKDQVIEEDFPGEDSVVEFLQRLANP